MASNTTAHDLAAGRNRGVTAGMIFVWLAIALALGFWLPLTFIIDSNVLQAGLESAV